MEYRNYLLTDTEVNCSTVVAGKNASATGKVLLGHNEDDGNCVVQLHIVPAAEHRAGEMIKFADGKAVIPQVEKTLGYYWSEVRTKAGISFADGFVNECGVVIVSNSCKPCQDPSGCPVDNKEDYHIGYGIRTLLAQRAVSARAGVQVVAELVGKYGYFSSRTYTIADKDEAWIVSIPKGHNFVARRVGDDEIFYIPNHFVIREVDFTDTEHKNYYWSENLVPYAIENGWYTPAVEGDWSDFDFVNAYQTGPKVKPNNLMRSRTAWKMLKDADLNEDNIRVFSMKADKKYTAEDFKKLLRSHHEGTQDDHTENYKYNPHLNDASSICGDTTVESIVVEFNEDINLTRMLRSSPKACMTPYTPWYPVALTRIPRGYNWMGYKAAYSSHFTVDEMELEYDPTKSWWTFVTLQYFTEFDYKNTHQQIKDSIVPMETAWEKEKTGVEAAYNALKDVDMDAAKEILTSYTCQQAQKTWDWAKSMIRKLGEERVEANKNHWG